MRGPILTATLALALTFSRGAAARPTDDLRGIYVRGVTAAAPSYGRLLERAAAHGLNAIVLDVKDYDGALTYPSRVPFAVEAGATKDAPLASYEAAVRAAHARGLRVIARISCFNDQLLARAHPSLAIRGVSGHVYHNGWVDPKNETVHAYLAALVREAIGFGVDEIQLDYVRFPVIGMKNIDYGLDTRRDPRAKVEVITRFVEKIHAITRRHGVPLSLDIFGVVSFGHDADIQNLGQDPAELSKHAEYLSAMVYPSHYDPGFMGLADPGAHPELVGLGVRHLADGLGGGRAKIRPWLQAMRQGASTYGAAYIREEIRSSDAAGGHGYLLWNPAQVYDVTWSALPRRR